MKNLNKKTFEEVLDELDRLLQEDYLRFQEDLKKMSIKEKMDKVFENPANNSTFVEGEDSRTNNNEEG